MRNRFDPVIAASADAWICRAAGDRSLVLEFGNTIDADLVEQVVALDVCIRHGIETGRLTGVRETVPTFRSLAIVFDPLCTSPAQLLEQLRGLEPSPEDTRSSTFRHWELPVRYGGDSGPDLDDVAERTGLTETRVAELHQQVCFRVYMLGFLPGFAFMGDTPPELHLPRRSEPRLRVPAGSVAIAMQLTGVYPWDSPGGWHILGQCPIPLFDASADPPALLKAGDSVRFRGITDCEFDAIRGQVREQSFCRTSLRRSAADS